MIAHVRHEAQLNQRTDDGSTVRAHLRAAGKPVSGPECPDVLRYLVDWAYTLYGRSGVDMNGPAPLSFATIAEWSRLTDTHIEPHEVDALIRIDAVIRHPDEAAEEKSAEPKPTPAWPAKKAQA